MFTMCNAALTHVEIPRPRDATELNNDNPGALSKVDIKVINASLTQSQCLQCVTSP